MNVIVWIFQPFIYLFFSYDILKILEVASFRKEMKKHQAIVCGAAEEFHFMYT